MKKVLIVLLSVLLALSSGLLVYGATQNVGNSGFSAANLGDLLPPEAPYAGIPELAEWIREHGEEHGLKTLLSTNPYKTTEDFATEANGWFDVFGDIDPSNSMLTRTSGAALAGNLLVAVIYNHNRTRQYCMASYIEVNAGKRTMYSNNLRVREHPEPQCVDRYYLSLTWTGTPITSYATLRPGFNDQSFSSSAMIQGYDPKTGEYEYKLGKAKESDSPRDPYIDSEFPYKTFGLLSLPIYLGEGSGSNGGAVDCSVIDGGTVTVTEPTEQKPYYTLTFSEDLVNAQRDENKLDRFRRAIGGDMSGVNNITIKKADFVFEIWGCGLLRQVTANFDINAKVGGQQGDATAAMSYKFYYDDYNCDIIRLIESVGWQKYLNDTNREKFEAWKERKNKTQKESV